MLPPPAPTFLTSTDEKPGDVAGEDAVQPGLARELHLAVSDDADVEAGAARVADDEVVDRRRHRLPATGAIAGPELTV